MPTSNNNRTAERLPSRLLAPAERLPPRPLASNDNYLSYPSVQNNYNNKEERVPSLGYVCTYILTDAAVPKQHDKASDLTRYSGVRGRDGWFNITRFHPTQTE
jgi:hypothetical protein